mmetsp:Transcript_88942/g.267512  ORF Transcript_88942/g.267512 Transcript_88942/m.267512 type:complete len:210 (-) Transcript_88942:409-1038(-)
MVLEKVPQRKPRTKADRRCISVAKAKCAVCVRCKQVPDEKVPPLVKCWNVGQLLKQVVQGSGIGRCVVLGRLDRVKNGRAHHVEEQEAIEHNGDTVSRPLVEPLGAFVQLQDQISMPAKGHQQAQPNHKVEDRSSGSKDECQAGLLDENGVPEGELQISRLKMLIHFLLAKVAVAPHPASPMNHKILDTSEQYEWKIQESDQDHLRNEA